MAEYLIQDTTLTDIADAIRTKKKSSETINVSDFASQIETIETEKTELLENVEIPVDFSNGNQTVEAEEGKAIKSAIIQKPAELVAENIKENTTIAGIAGTLPVYELTEKNVELDFSVGDVVVVAENRKPFSKVTINKPETLVAENIAKDINIAGIIGTLESGGGEGEAVPADRYFEGGYAEVNLPNAEAIKKYAFYYDDKLTNITMPKVKSIGGDAFNGCNKLALTSLPSGITSIAEYAFKNCGKLALTSLPSGITSIAEYAFKNCGKLALTSLPESLTEIKTTAFQSCTNLALTSLPEGITSIGTYAFNKCSNLALTSLPNNLTIINDYAFGDCTNLALTSLPSGITSIGSSAFTNCSKLALTSLPNGVTTIKSMAFYNCTELALTSLPESLTRIEGSGFNGCSKLALTSLPSSLTNIGGYAFARCTGLTSITFEGKPSTIANDAFYNCTNLTTINVPWAEGEVANAPWGATNATINYNYVEG